MARPKQYPEELIQRGIRLALESDRPIARIAADLGIHSKTLRTRVRQAEADSGARPELLSSSEREGDPEIGGCAGRTDRERPERAVCRGHHLFALLGRRGVLRVHP